MRRSRYSAPSRWGFGESSPERRQLPRGRKAILVANGVIQAAGVTAVVLGLVLLGRHTELVTAEANRARTVRVSVLPSQMGANGYGLAALGDF